MKTAKDSSIENTARFYGSTAMILFAHLSIAPVLVVETTPVLASLLIDCTDAYRSIDLASFLVSGHAAVLHHVRIAASSQP